MNDEPSPLEGLLRRAAQGSDEAAQELVTRYGEHIRRSVRRRLPQQLRATFDSLDLVQDVWASFFAALPQPAQFADAEQLIAFLTAVARNKVVDVVRRQLPSGRPLAAPERQAPCGDGVALAAPEPSPSAVLIGEETWERLLRGQPPVHRRILMLLREGRSQTEIAEKVVISAKTVQRVIRNALRRVSP